MISKYIKFAFISAVIVLTIIFSISYFNKIKLNNIESKLINEGYNFNDNILSYPGVYVTFNVNLQEKSLFITDYNGDVTRLDDGIIEPTQHLSKIDIHNILKIPVNNSILNDTIQILNLDITFGEYGDDVSPNQLNFISSLINIGFEYSKSSQGIIKDDVIYAKDNISYSYSWRKDTFDMRKNDNTFFIAYPNSNSHSSYDTSIASFDMRYATQEDIEKFRNSKLMKIVFDYYNININSFFSQY